MLDFLTIELLVSQKEYYHYIISLIMIISWFLFSWIAYRKKNIVFYSYLLLFVGIIQEAIDYMNRFFLDAQYHISWQRDLPLHFCHLGLYFSLFCIYKCINNRNNKSISRPTQFLFACAFILGLTGAFQGIFTPDWTNIYNFLGILCGQLQHSLIILNVLWLIFAYGLRIYFKDCIQSYMFVNILVFPALLLNYFLGTNAQGLPANYLYVNALPDVSNPLLNLISSQPFPWFILYIQPIIIIYIIILYIPFKILNYYK